jgi:hypothetical protein
VKAILLLDLNVRGVYAEVSDGVERIVAGRAPEVRLDVAEQVLGKAVVPHEDGRHYTRGIINVGSRRNSSLGDQYWSSLRARRQHHSKDPFAA